MLCVYLEKFLNMLKNLFNNKKKNEKCNFGLILKKITEVKNILELKRKKN